MAQIEIGPQRLVSQQVTQPTATQPHEVVQRLGAVQAQDFLGALWAIGLRTPGATEQSIEQALAERTIIRTWPMRGTLHFVAAADVRWMLELLTPRVIQRSQRRLKQLGLDAATLAASATIVANALQGGKQIIRSDLFAILDAAHISTEGQRGIHILNQLAHRQLICFGARAGKQPTFALLDEWLPSATSLPRDEALATLALRYFTGHGPATLQDLIWWSGLTVADARAALAAAAPQLGHERHGALDYYFDQTLPRASPNVPNLHLLPPFDEFLLGYRDRSAVLAAEHAGLVAPGANGIFNPIIVVDGRVVGTWKRVLKGDRVQISFSAFDPTHYLDPAALDATAARYAAFVGKQATPFSTADERR